MSESLANLSPPEPEKPSQNVHYRQGTVIEFDQATLENLVDVGGTQCLNLPLLGVAEAASLTPGSIVGLMAIEGTKGTVTYAILGRMVTPNTAAAAEATSLLSSRIIAASVPIQQTGTTVGYGDLATVGPTVEVNVGASGRLLVMISCQMQWVDADAADGNGGMATIEVSGANTLAPTAADDLLHLTTFWGSTATANATMQGTYAGFVVLDGLNPGLTTITMKYSNQVASESVDYGKRSLVVIQL